MNTLSHERKVQAINAMCQGMSLRAATRLLGTHRTTIMKLLLRVGERCEQVMDVAMRDLDCQQLQIDEIWTFCGKKQRHLATKEKHDRALGDQFLFYGIDPKTKLVPAWALGKRDFGTAFEFVSRLKGTLNGVRPQISSDAFAAYRYVIEDVFGLNVDYGTVTKEYKGVPVGRGRYAPPEVSRTIKYKFIGNPDAEKICTSHIERCNLTLRTFQRRFTRLSLGFSKNLENLKAAVALHFGYYNFCWIPRTTKITPAMAAGITSEPWEIKDLVGDC